MPKVTPNFKSIDLSTFSPGQLGRVISTRDNGIGNDYRIGQIFLTGAYKIMFLDDGGIYTIEDVERTFNTILLDPGTSITLTQE
jgi:hypothetical protein